jgi:hypothetical protein
MPAGLGDVDGRAFSGVLRGQAKPSRLEREARSAAIAEGETEIADRQDLVTEGDRLGLHGG